MKALAEKKAKEAARKKLEEQAKQMALDDKLSREAQMLKNLVEADEAEKQEETSNNNYFEREKT
jgi:hypothetical protein